MTRITEHFYTYGAGDFHASQADIAKFYEERIVFEPTVRTDIADLQGKERDVFPPRLGQVERVVEGILTANHGRMFKGKGPVIPDVRVKFYPDKEIEKQKKEYSQTYKSLAQNVIPFGVNVSTLEYIPGRTFSYRNSDGITIMLREKYPEELSSDSCDYVPRIMMSQQALLYGIERMFHTIALIPPEEPLTLKLTPDRSIIPLFQNAVNSSILILARNNPNINRAELEEVRKRMNSRLVDGQDRRITHTAGEIHLYEPKNSQSRLSIGQNINYAIVWKIVQELIPQYLENLSHDSETKEWFLTPKAWPEKPEDIPRGVRAAILENPEYGAQTIDILTLMPRVYQGILNQISSNAQSEDDILKTIPVLLGKKNKRFTDISTGEMYRIFASGELLFVLDPAMRDHRKDSFTIGELQQELVMPLVGELKVDEATTGTREFNRIPRKKK